MKESGLWICGWVALLPFVYTAFEGMGRDFDDGGFFPFTFVLWALAHYISRPQDGDVASLKLDIKKAEIRNRLAEIEQELAKQGG